jgi:hypothetical protein
VGAAAGATGYVAGSPSRGPRPSTREARANHATDASQQTSPLKLTIEFSGVGGAGAAVSALGALGVLGALGTQSVPASQPASSSQTLCPPVHTVAAPSKRLCRAGCDGAHELSDVTRHAKVHGQQYCVTKSGDFEAWMRGKFPNETDEFFALQVSKRQKLIE